MKQSLVCITYNRTPQRILDKIYLFYKNNEKKVNKWIDEGVKENLFTGWVILSTCQRFEIYSLTPNLAKFKKFTSDLLSKMTGSNLSKYVDVFTSKEAMKHLVKVAGGVDSKIIGEVDIFNQVKKAHESVRTNYAKGGPLSMFFGYSMRLAIKWRNRTSLEQGTTSYAGIALEAIKKKFPKLDKKFLILGTGMMGSFFLKNFQRKKPKAVYLSSRNMSHVKQLADLFKVKAVDLKKNPNILSKVDVFICCLAGRAFLTLKQIRKHVKKDMLVLDLGVPPNLPKTLENIRGVTVYRMEDFEKLNGKDQVLKENVKRYVIQEIDKEIEKNFDKLIMAVPKIPSLKQKDCLCKYNIPEQKIRAYALENAIKHGGKPSEKSIINKLFKEGLTKEKVTGICPQLRSILKELRNSSLQKQENEFLKLKRFIKEKPRRDDVLPELPFIRGNVITRIAPEPSKHLHIGHALVFLIQYFYAKKYGGKCILRMEDTNPEKSNKDYYDSIKKDLKWLGINWDEEVIVSKDMELFYKYAAQLIKQKDAYVCSCPSGKMRRLRNSMEKCCCRMKDAGTNLDEWKQMLKGKYKEGERTLRLKGYMGSNNGAMRDPVIFRISSYPHFLQAKKYCVWPMYDFENAIQDAVYNITHVVRTKEFEMREKLQKYILYLLNLEGPVVKEISRYDIKGVITKGRIIRKLIEEGKIKGWDDPRLATIKALRKRGFVPEMFKELAKKVGLSKSSGKIDFSVLEALNKKIIDSMSNRYFLADAHKIKIENAPKLKIKVPLHPSDPKRGVREFETGQEFFITEKDLKKIKKLKAEDVRLMNLFNFRNINGKYVFDSVSMNKELNTKIHWLPADRKNSKKLIPIEVIMPDSSVIKVVGEEGVRKVKPGEIVQFERFGFSRLNKKTKNKMIFCYAHN